jgi:hypothetical protein
VLAIARHLAAAGIKRTVASVALAFRAAAVPSIIGRQALASNRIYATHFASGFYWIANRTKVNGATASSGLQT